MTFPITRPYTLLTETTAAASGAYAATGIVVCTRWRRCAVWLNADCAAASGYIVVVPRFSPGTADPPDTTPAFGDDVWYPVMVNDSAPVPTLYTGTRVTGVDYTGAPEFGTVTVRPLALRFEAHDASTNEIRGVQDFEIPAGARYLSFEYAEVGTTGTPSALSIVLTFSE